MTGTDLFLVEGRLHGARMRITAGSPPAAAAAAAFWRGLGAHSVDWMLRADLADLAHRGPVLLFTQHGADPAVHVTELVAGTPISQHPATSCTIPLHRRTVRVCGQAMALPCPACHTVIQAARG